MKSRSTAGAPAHAESTAALLCHIQPADVEAMLDAYDSGMCDTSTANCLSRAVARSLQKSQPIPLIRHGASQASLVLEDLKIPVPPEILEWLQAAEIGSKKGPIEFVLNLPLDSIPTVSRKESQSLAAPPPMDLAI